MKGFKFVALFLFVSSTLVCLSHSTNEGIATTRRGSDMTTATSNRKLKQKSTSVNLLDYDPIDPVPSSMNSITSGPIQHATPLMPYLPNPHSPPGPDHQNISGLP